MDRCKQVKEFYDDQISRYKEYLSFVHENELNFAELTGCDESVKSHAFHCHGRMAGGQNAPLQKAA